MEFLLKKKIDFSHKKILDFGCGNAYLKRWIQQKEPTAEYVGVEFSYNSISEIKRKCENIEIYHITEAIDLHKEKYDIIFATELIEHLTDEYLLKDIEIWKMLLKKEGVLVITTPNNENLDNSIVYCPNCDCYYHKWQHIRSWNKENIKQYFEKNGLTTVFCEETMLYSLQKSKGYNKLTKMGRFIKTAMGAKK